MAPVFWLNVTNNKEKYGRDHNLRPRYITSLLLDKKLNKVTVTDSFDSLNYFDDEADLDVSKMQSKFQDVIDKLSFTNCNHSKLLNDFLRRTTHIFTTITANKNIFSRIMNTPFEINRDKRKWIINAEICDKNCINLYFDDAEEDKLSDAMAKQYELLKRYLFMKMPVDYYRNVTAAFNDVIFCEIINFEFGTHELYFTTEIAGVDSEKEITDVDELNDAGHIYCDIFDADELSQDVINYNPIWWSNAKLMNAKQCILGAYDKHNDCLKEIIQFNMDKFEDKAKYENLWSPDAAWNFLHDFLDFVRDAMNSVSSDGPDNCVWRFQSFPDGKPVVSCEILNYTRDEKGVKTLTPLSVDKISSL